MAKHIFLVDGNSIGHANHNASQLTVGGFQTQAIYGFLRTLRAMRERATGDTAIQILWDGKAQHRLAIYPAYKGNRKPLDAKQAAHKEAYSRQVPILEKAIECLGIPQLRCNYLEADDLAGLLVKSYVAQGIQVTLVSGDQDWLQLVSPHVTWFDPIRDRTVTHENFLEFTGFYTTAAFLQGKALQGDTSDNIDGIAGMGEKTAALFLAEWKSLAHFYKALQDGTHTPKERGKSAKSLHPEQILASPEGKAIVRRNLALMDMARAPAPKAGDLMVNRKPPNAAAFLALCERLAFASILRERHSFLEVFGMKVPEGYEWGAKPIARPVTPVESTVRAATAGVESAAESLHADSAFAEEKFDDVPY